eukprot:145928-Chlamydomonas_euryale.AAC.1
MSGWIRLTMLGGIYICTWLVTRSDLASGPALAPSPWVDAFTIRPQTHRSHNITPPHQTNAMTPCTVPTSPQAPPCSLPQPKLTPASPVAASTPRALLYTQPTPFAAPVTVPTPPRPPRLQLRAPPAPPRCAAAA